MPESDDNPRAARRLREFGRRRAPDDLASQHPGPHHKASPTATTLAPGSIWGPPTAVESPSTVLGEPAAAAPEPNPKGRRRAGERSADPDAVTIDGDTSHDWWSKRDDLDQVVNPKKRGAAARAERAAREAFAPPGAANVPSGDSRPHSDPLNSTAPGTHGKWDPSDVYSWSTAGSADPPPRMNDSAVGASSWNDGWDRDHDDTRVSACVQEPTSWDVLGLTSEATWAEVTRRHKQLAKEHHPDRHTEADIEAKRAAENRMSEINAAFSDLRRIYQLTGGT